MSEQDLWFFGVLAVVYLLVGLWFAGVTLGLTEDSDTPTWLLYLHAGLLGLFWPVVLVVGSGIKAGQRGK